MAKDEAHKLESVTSLVNNEQLCIQSTMLVVCLVTFLYVYSRAKLTSKLHWILKMLLLVMAGQLAEIASLVLLLTSIEHTPVTYWIFCALRSLSVLQLLGFT